MSTSCRFWFLSGISTVIDFGGERNIYELKEEYKSKTIKNAIGFPHLGQVVELSNPKAQVPGIVPASFYSLFVFILNTQIIQLLYSLA